MRNSQYTVLILIISWFFFILGCGVTAAYLKVSTQFDTQGRRTEAAQLVREEQQDIRLQEQEYEKKVCQIKDFMSQYYEYLEQGDRTHLLEMVEDSDSFITEKKLTNMTLYIKEYQNINCYIKKAVDENSFIVFVSYDTKFYDVEEMVPGISQYYVVWEQGRWIIYNNKEHLTTEAENAMKVSLRLKDMKQLIEETTDEYEKIMEGNKKLRDFFED